MSSAADVPIIRPPTLAAKLSPVPRKVGRIDARQVVAPETELRDRQEAERRRSPTSAASGCSSRRTGRRAAAGSGPGIWKRCSSSTPAHDAAPPGTRATMRPARPPNSWNDCTALTVCSLHRPRQRPHFREARHDARHLLNRAERRAVGARHHDRRHDRRPAELGPEQLAEARTLERAGRLLLAPRR